MKTQIPYNAGDFVQHKTNYGSGRFVVMGHVWWPIERTNAYYMLRVNEYGEPVDDVPEYLWDNRSDDTSKFKYFTPKAEAA